MSFQFPVYEGLELGARGHLGVGYMLVRHRVEGSMSDGDDTIAASVSHSDKLQKAVLLFAWPEAFVAYRIRPFRFGLSLGALVFMTNAPKGPHEALRPKNPSNNCPSLACTGDSNAVAGERAFGPSGQFAGSLFAGYTF
jgi:hypothetical protein